MLASSTTHAENVEASNNHQRVCNQLGGVKNGILFKYSDTATLTLILHWRCNGQDLPTEK